MRKPGDDPNDTELLAAARRRATRELEIWAPEDIREYSLVREAGESDEHFAARERLISAILDKAGIEPAYAA